MLSAACPSKQLVYIATINTHDSVLPLAGDLFNWIPGEIDSVLAEDRGRLTARVQVAIGMVGVVEISMLISTSRLRLFKSL